jgi:hypothetical protein
MGMQGGMPHGMPQQQGMGGFPQQQVRCSLRLFVSPSPSSFPPSS